MELTKQNACELNQTSCPISLNSSLTTISTQFIPPSTMKDVKPNTFSGEIEEEAEKRPLPWGRNIRSPKRIFLRNLTPFTSQIPIISYDPIDSNEDSPNELTLEDDIPTPPISPMFSESDRDDFDDSDDEDSDDEDLVALKASIKASLDTMKNNRVIPKGILRTPFNTPCSSQADSQNSYKRGVKWALTHEQEEKENMKKFAPSPSVHRGNRIVILDEGNLEDALMNVKSDDFPTPPLSPASQEHDQVEKISNFPSQENTGTIEGSEKKDSMNSSLEYEENAETLSIALPDSTIPTPLENTYRCNALTKTISLCGAASFLRRRESSLFNGIPGELTHSSSTLERSNSSTLSSLSSNHSIVFSNHTIVELPPSPSRLKRKREVGGETVAPELELFIPVAKRP